MTKPQHKSAASTHYDAESATYDGFNEINSQLINSTIEGLLTKHKAENILDLSCGTGSQVFWLHNKGFIVHGVDISPSMLKIARKKAKQQGLTIKFQRGDMRTTRAGEFDAVLTIFNAVGHLTKRDFIKTMRNAYANLQPGGLYIFDIFNLNYLLAKDHITRLTMDNLTMIGNTQHREVQYSTINSQGVLASYDFYYTQRGSAAPKLKTAAQTLQVYTRQQLKDMLQRCGFSVLRQCNIDGGRLSETKIERILTVARKPV